MATVSIPDTAIPKACRAISNNIILDKVFYNSGDLELKDPFGQLIILNTINCDNYNFSYSKSVIALRISDNSNILITNFPTPINGATTSGDYLSVFTTNYKNSPYVINVVLTATLQGSALVYISKTIYLNAYLAKFIVPPYNSLKYVKLIGTDISEDFSIEIGIYFLFISNLKIYTKCKVVDESGNEIPWLYEFTLIGNTCSFSVDKSK